VSTANARILEDARVGVRLKISALWIAMLFLFAYGDIFGFFKPWMVSPVVDEGFHEDGVDRLKIVARFDPADLDARRRRPRLGLSGEVYLHVPEVPDRSQASDAQHRRGRAIPRVDRMAEPR
jgi:hypothetical protein